MGILLKLKTLPITIYHSFWICFSSTRLWEKYLRCWDNIGFLRFSVSEQWPETWGQYMQNLLKRKIYVRERKKGRDPPNLDWDQCELSNEKQSRKLINSLPIPPWRHIWEKGISVPKTRERAMTESGFKPPMPQISQGGINNVIFCQVFGREVRWHDQMFCPYFRMDRRPPFHL